jgi:hypothetical protein
MHKLLFSLLFTLFCEFTFAQNCSICPSGTTVQLTSPYPATATHLWTCTDGFTSTQQNPTFNPIADVTCSLTATESGCTATSQSIVDVCDCACNENACIAMNYNSSTECVTFANTGTPCSPLATETRQWRNLTSNPWTNIPVSNQICDCDIRERVNTTATVSVVSGAFRLQINGLQNRCSTCSGSNMQIEFVFGVTGFNSTLFPGCAGTTDWYTITAANFATAGYVANAYVRYTTPYGVVVNYYRFTYNGGGLAAGNVTVQQVYRKSIYKTIYTQRTLTFTDGCPSVTCNNSLAIPQQPNDPCTHFVAYITTVNLGAPCSGAGLSASTINATGPLTYQWKYNGTNIAGQTSQFLCMVGRPNGTYCCVVSDGTCTEEICIIVQPACTLAVSVTSSVNTLTANLTGCVGTPTYQWQRWNGTSWINVGTNSNTYNTGGLAGEYRVNVSCSGPPACSAIGYITFTPPCTADVTISVGATTLTANVTGCGGTNITYLWERWNGTTWVTVQTVTTTSTSNIYTPTISGLYRVTITCNGCSDQTQTTFTLPNPCTGFSANITGTFTGLCVGNTYTFNRTITGGTGPFTQVWTINGLGAGTGTSLNFTPLAAGAVTIAITVTDANNCSYTDSQVVNVIVCCGITLSISPTSTSVCTNQDATFTVTATGGTAPYSYSWTYSVPSGSVIGAGTGNPKTFNFPTANTYTLVCTVTDAVGCQFSIFATMTVTNCTNCVCTPNLVLNGCVLNGSFTGAGCPNFTYQLQYSATGTGWSIAASGTASNGGTFTHTPTANGFYRLVIVASGCTLQQTADVNVNCVVSCGCTVGTLTYNTSTCLLSWTNTCSGYLADLERFNGATWVFVSQTNPFSPTQDGLYRVTYRKGGCPDVSSNTVLIDLLLDCNTNYGDWNEDGFTDFLPEQIHPDHAHFFGSPFNNMLSYTSAAYCNNIATSSNWSIIWGDGSSNTTGTGYTPTVNHTYSANGTYKQEYDLTTTLGLCEQDSYVYPNGTGNAVPTLELRGNCGDGAYPILFSRPSCGMVDIWIGYNVYGFGSFTAPTYTSHTVKINGTTYTVPITFDQTLPNLYWTITNTTPISIPLSALNNNINTIEVTVTVNSNQILKNKGYFRIVCN